MSCPADKTIRALITDTDSTVVTYAKPTVTGNSNPVNILCTQLSNTAFVVGTTTVTCYALADTTMLASCSFVVTVTVSQRKRVLGAPSRVI